MVPLFTQGGNLSGLDFLSQLEELLGFELLPEWLPGSGLSRSSCCTKLRATITQLCLRQSPLQASSPYAPESIWWGLLNDFHHGVCLSSGSLSVLYTFGSRHLTGQQDSLQGHRTLFTCIEGPAWDCSWGWVPVQRWSCEGLAGRVKHPLIPERGTWDRIPSDGVIQGPRPLARAKTHRNWK